MTTFEMIGGVWVNLAAAETVRLDPAPDGGGPRTGELVTAGGQKLPLAGAEVDAVERFVRRYRNQ